MPEQAAYAPHFSGIADVADNALTSDAPEFADPEQGIPTLRGLMCKVYLTERSPEYSQSLAALGESWGGFSDTWGGPARRKGIEEAEKRRLEAQTVPAK